MGAPRAVAVVGYKNAGKTRVVESLTAALNSKGRSVATLKHTSEDISFDKHGTDTSRHLDAGAIASAILSEKRAAIFLRRSMSLQNAVDALGEVDYVILEGFKTLDIVPRIIVPRKIEDIDELSNGLQIAVVDLTGEVHIDKTIPFFSLAEISKLSDLVEEKAHPLLAGLNCKECGYESCKELSRSILVGDKTANNCIKYQNRIILKTNGKNITLNPFVKSALKNTVLGFMRALKDVEVSKRVELEFEVNDEGGKS